MAISFTNTFDGAAVLTGAQLDANFQDAADYSAAIPGSDLQDATIANSKLINSNFEFMVSLKMLGSQTGAVSATHPKCTVGLPNLSGDTASYTVLGATYLCTDTGSAGTLTFSVQLGYYNAGTWTNVIAGSALVLASKALTGATVQQSGAMTITTAVLPMHASLYYHLGLFLGGTLDATALNAAGDFLDVTLRLKRTAGLRS